LLTSLKLSDDITSDKISEMESYLVRNKKFFETSRFKKQKLAVPASPDSSENDKNHDLNSESIDIDCHSAESVDVKNKKRKSPASDISDAPPLKRAKLNFASNPFLFLNSLAPKLKDKERSASPNESSPPSP
jgi:hypothetical protein